MNKWMGQIIGVVAVACMLTACNKNGDSGQDSTVAVPPAQSYIQANGNQCLQQQQGGYGTSGFGGYSGSPYSPYNYNNPYQQSFQTAGFCGCQYGTVPACGQYGMVCVPQYNQVQNINWYGYQNGGFGGAPQNGGWNGYSGYGSGGNNCYSHVGQACQIGVYESCGAYGSCQPVGNGSPYGICAN